ncbi:MAG TPA: alpha/beta hydrolase [Vicinamibacterales bacterium]|nr:alpha/beta hydrolase [Vicinamibacterales bacterium]
MRSAEGLVGRPEGDRVEAIALSPRRSIGSQRRGPNLGIALARRGLALGLLMAASAMAHGRSNAAYDVHVDVVYTPARWPQALRSDLYVPSGRGPFPAVVVVHGGGWNGRDRHDMTSLSESLAEQGIVALNIEYRLAPAFHHPAPVEDVRAAISYLRQHAPEWKIDASRLGGWGYSAGAHLVTLAANAADRGVPLMKALVAGGMPADFRRYPDSPVISQYIGKPYVEATKTWEAASPLLNVSADDPPMFLYHGNWDRIVEPAELPAMQAALEQNGVKVQTLKVSMLGHIGTFLFSRQARREGIAFLKHHLIGSSSPAGIP